MKTLITLILVIFSTTLAFSETNEKFYQVTDNGQFLYTYWLNTSEMSSKAGVKPVTERTFFLETKRNGLLPTEMTYLHFQQLSVEEKQHILNNSQTHVIAATIGEPQVINTSLATGDFNLPEIRTTDRIDVTETTFPEISENHPYDSNLPWLVRVITTPEDGIDLSTEKIEFTKDNKQTIPWIVDVVLKDGKLTETTRLSNALEVVESLNASKQ